MKKPELPISILMGVSCCLGDGRMKKKILRRAYVLALP